MEADWSVEIGADLPMIVVPWESYIDLRQSPLLVSAISEAASAPELSQALLDLNQESSPVFTSKCDLWSLPEDEIDLLEFDARREKAKQGIACYIDVIARNPELFASFQANETLVRAITEEMRQVSMPQAHAELVVRSAEVEAKKGFAMTLYVAACGANEVAVHNIFSSALKIATTITMKQAIATGE